MQKSVFPFQYQIIDQTTQLKAAVSSLEGIKAIALDTESNSRHHYPEQLCLIQISDGSRIYLIDPLSLKDLSPLEQVLADHAVQKVLHGADYDVRCFDRHYEFHFSNLFDTSVAARFAGIEQFGLASLIKTLLGITISKNERIQQSDWGKRPLSLEALDYAAGDVLQLLALRDVLEQRLRILGRSEWVEEEFVRLEAVRYTVPNLQTAFFDIKGAQNLDGRGLAILRNLFLFRDQESRRQGRPPFFIIPDPVLIALADQPTSNLLKVPGLSQFGLQQFGSSLQQALREGQAADPIQLPPHVDERLSPDQVVRLKRLKAWRTDLGASLTLDPSLLWPTVSLENLAKSPACFEIEAHSSRVRSWQRAQFADSLGAVLKSIP